jgi:hypothetical protein
MQNKYANNVWFYEIERQCHTYIVHDLANGMSLSTETVSAQGKAWAQITGTVGCISSNSLGTSLSTSQAAPSCSAFNRIGIGALRRTAQGSAEANERRTMNS